MKRTIIASLMVFALGCNTAAEKTSKTGSVVAGLKTFGSCSELSGFLSSKAGTGTATPGTASPGTATGGAAADAPAPTATPQTTVPEEADLVKQDGNRLYILNASSGLLIYDLTTPSHPERLGRLPFQGTTPLEIQVSGQDVLVVSLSYGNAPAAPRSVMGMPVYAPPTTQATVLDVSDPASPTIVQQWTFDGTYQESRKVGSAVYLVLQHWIGGDVKTMDSQLETSDPCDQIYAPENLDGGNYASFNSWDVVGLNMNDPNAAPNRISVIGSYASTVYATPNHLYVTDYSFDGNKTAVYLLGLNDATAGVVPLATASVPGSIVNQFSLDEIGDETGGVFRIASSTTAENFWVEGSPVGTQPALIALPPEPVPPTPDFKNYITTFDLHADQLTPLGQIDTIAPGETITAARFLGTHAFVTTAIGYVDPLVSVDLTDPAHPALKGSVALPGRPGYIHAWNNLLITVGQGDGWAAGVTLNLFDISDMDHPSLIQQVTVPDASYSEAETDHRAFAFFEDRGLLALPVWTDTTSKMVLYRVDPAIGFSALGDISHDNLLGGNQTIDYSPTMLRALEAGDDVITISEAGIKSSALSDPRTDLFGELFPGFSTPQ